MNSPTETINACDRTLEIVDPLLEDKLFFDEEFQQRIALHEDYLRGEIPEDFNSRKALLEVLLRKKVDIDRGCVPGEVIETDDTIFVSDLETLEGLLTEGVL